MNRWWLSLGTLLLCLPAVWAWQDDKKAGDKPAASPKEEFDKLAKEYLEARQALIKEFQAAKNDEERKKIRDQFGELQKSPGKILDLAEKHAQEPFAVDALVWVIQQGAGPQKAIGLLQKHHVANPKIGAACEAVAEYTLPEVDQLLRAVVAKNNDKTAQGIATLSLAKNLRAQAENAAAEPAKKLNEEADKLLATAVEKYADVKTSASTVGQEAKTILSLALGKPMPEIAGEDLDGVKFKLSDYRGKVVLLDFWGHW